ncbi:M48 family metallopeptidase [Parabacteroides sp. OttesenSCG-928-G07]|nr:M48 family metallopeptidase [Parabacteroides sp. OttesenSCG-928-G21]MDL2278731.1 M48 family metallopeptidase [Parabacteroides sp. OttesenSCG-928-G07]
MEKKIHDNELGTILLRKGARYKRYTLKISEGEIVGTMPLHGSEAKMKAFIEEKRTYLLQMLLKNPPPVLLDDTTELQLATCRLQIQRAERKNIRTVLKDGLLTVTCPFSVDFKEERIQQLLREIIKNVSRHEAKRVLPGRLDQLARQHGFAYTEVKINSSKTRWGSCTSRKSINLSLFLMQLPWHLIDYVLLHELCHTVEMNHSERFWLLMNKVTGNKAKALRKELKGYHVLK